MAAHMSDKVGNRVAFPAETERKPSEAELLQGIARGEKWAADALYETLYPSVARGLQRVLHEVSPDYEDLVQTTFERIMRVLLEERSQEVLNLTAWASGIAAHVALDAIRKRVRERRLFRSDEPDSPGSVELARAPSNEQRIEARHQLSLVHGVLSSMKSEVAETVVLHDLVGHDLREIAAITGVTVAAAQSRLVRGRKELLRLVQLRSGKEQG